MSPERWRRLKISGGLAGIVAVAIGLFMVLISGQARAGGLICFPFIASFAFFMAFLPLYLLIVPLADEGSREPVSLNEVELAAKLVSPEIDAGEKVIAVTMGMRRWFPYEVILAMTDKRFLSLTLDGGDTIPFSDVEVVRISGLWPRLRLQTRSRRRSLLLSIDGWEWRASARQIVSEWKSRTGDTRRI